MSEKHSTLRMLSDLKPDTYEDTVVRRYLFYPDQTGQRVAEGGLRTRGNYKCNERLPLVSVITVTLNAAETLEQCIRSVLRQTYDNVEYIVVDGVSTDGTIELLKKYEYAIDYFISEPDDGLYQAMNKGISLATGDYILVLNADDWYVKTCTEELIKAKRYSSADFVSALAQYVDQQGEPVEIMRHMSYNDSVRIRMPLRHETMLIADHIYDRLGQYDETYRIISDYQYTIRLLEAGYTLYELQRPLLNFRNTGVSNANMSDLIAERIRLLKEIFPFLKDEEAWWFGDILKLVPEKLINLVNSYPDKPKLYDSLRMYYLDRKRTALAPLWRESNLNWPDLDNEVPLVSVILPVFNAQDTLQECVDSVLAQSLENIELICIDDRSSDNSRNILESYMHADPRIKYLKNKKNIGHGATRNRGIKAARGSYISFIDADDTIPPDALSSLYKTARKNNCDVVKGAYIHERIAFDDEGTKREIKTLCTDGEEIINTCVAETPRLLMTTEGHWSFLYSRDLIKLINYSTDLEVGEDGIFLIKALLRAEKISVINDIVYCYRSNANSAMSNFTYQKYMDALEWRWRAWHILKDAGRVEIGNHILQAYWSDYFFYNLVIDLNYDQIKIFLDKFRELFFETGTKFPTCKTSELIGEIFPLILEGEDEYVYSYLRLAKPIKVATWCSMDHGGAGIGSQRRVAALRRLGLDARIYSLVVKSQNSYVKRIIPENTEIDVANQDDVWKGVYEVAVDPARALPGYCSRELFSLTNSIIDFRDLENIFDNMDLIHLHWDA